MLIAEWYNPAACGPFPSLSACLKKFNRPGFIKFARDLGRAKSRATTTELVPR